MFNKVLFSFFLVLLLITLGSFLITDYFKKSTSKLCGSLNQVENTLGASSINGKSKALTDFRAQWQASRDTWAILIDHMEIDNIEESLIRLEEYVKLSDTSQALPQLAVLREQIAHIYEKERLQLKNIL